MTAPCTSRLALLVALTSECVGIVKPPGHTPEDEEALPAASLTEPDLYGAGSVRQLTRSLLVHKLEGVDAAGAAVCGDRMPDLGASVDPRWIAAVREWIANGANP